MSCDYPCSICDPEAWAEETKPPPYNFDAVYERTASGLERAFDKDKSIMWWVPMEGWPYGVAIREDREYEEYCLAGSRWPMTQLAANHIYLERERPGWQAGIERFRIISYMQHADWDQKLLSVTAVQSSTPPPWGWWMPTLCP